MNPAAIFAFFTVIIIAGCNNREDVTIKYVDNDPLYFDYKIWGEEGRDEVTVLLQYRGEDQDGLTRLLKNPSKVEFDGVLLKADSSKMSGYFYELEKKLDSFAGSHLITFTDSSGKQFKEPFEFSLFTLKTELPAVVHRDSLTFQLDGLKAVDYIRIIALDTAFKSTGINEVDTIKNGHVIISRNKLKNLVNGRIHLELYKEQEWPVKNATTAGGFLSVTYGLKGDFELAD
jgi:hypothetical protein